MRFVNISFLKVFRWFLRHEPAKPDMFLVCVPYEYTYLMHVHKDQFTVPLIRVNAYDNPTFDAELKAAISQLTPNSMIIANDDLLETIKRLLAAAPQPNAASTA